MKKQPTTGPADGVRTRSLRGPSRHEGTPAFDSRRERESETCSSFAYEPDTDTHVGPLPELKSIAIDVLLDPDPTPLDPHIKTAPSDDRPSGQVTPYSFTVPQPPSTLVASLVVLAGPAAGRVFPLREDQTTIGRSPAAHIQIEDIKISRLHARIVRNAPGEYYLEDLASKNGTFIGGRPVQRARLFTGDRVNIGSVTAVRFGLVAEDEVALQHRLYRSSTWDTLTGALTRAALLRRLEIEFDAARDASAALSVLMIDVDHFKRVNDSFGHKAGDQVLHAFVERLKRLVPADALVGRVGGEEFVVALPRCPLEQAAVLADRWRGQIEGLRVEIGNGCVTVTASIGVAALSELGDRTASDLLHLADLRLLDAKRGGRNQVRFKGHAQMDPRLL